ncbi:MAG: hypothetical protein IJ455_04885 [Agathobacter sp.]|nr:hypothetical protein [Agathobacter sp.]
MQQKNNTTWVMVIPLMIAFAIGYMFFDGSILAIMLMWVVLMVPFWLIASNLESKAKKRINEQVSKENQENVQKMTQYLSNYKDSKDVQPVLEDGIFLVFKGSGGNYTTSIIYGAISKKCCVLINHLGELVEYVSSPYGGKIEFKTYKKEYTVHGKEQMDVGRAAMLGNALGGIGAGAYSAAKAVEINANGGLDVSEKRKTVGLAIETQNMKVEIDRLYCYEDNKQVDYFKPKGNEAKKLVESLNKLMNS